MIISERSKLEGRENVDKIEQYIERGDNVIFLSNHQTEADPQVRSLTALLSLPRYSSNRILGDLHLIRIHSEGFFG